MHNKIRNKSALEYIVGYDPFIAPEKMLSENSMHGLLLEDEQMLRTIDKLMDSMNQASKSFDRMRQFAKAISTKENSAQSLLDFIDILEQKANNLKQEFLAVAPDNRGKIKQFFGGLGQSMGKWLSPKFVKVANKSADFVLAVQGFDSLIKSASKLAGQKEDSIHNNLKILAKRLEADLARMKVKMIDHLPALSSVLLDVSKLLAELKPDDRRTISSALPSLPAAPSPEITALAGLPQVNSGSGQLSPELIQQIAAALGIKVPPRPAEPASTEQSDAGVDAGEPSEAPASSRGRRTRRSPGDMPQHQASGLDAMGNFFRKQVGMRDEKQIKKHVRQLQRSVQGAAKKQGLQLALTETQRADLMLQNMSLQGLIVEAGYSKNHLFYYTKRMDQSQVNNFINECLKKGETNPIVFQYLTGMMYEQANDKSKPFKDEIDLESKNVKIANKLYNNQYSDVEKQTAKKYKKDSELIELARRILEPGEAPSDASPEAAPTPSPPEAPAEETASPAEPASPSGATPPARSERRTRVNKISVTDALASALDKIHGELEDEQANNLNGQDDKFIKKFVKTLNQSLESDEQLKGKYKFESADRSGGNLLTERWCKLAGIREEGE